MLLLDRFNIVAMSAGLIGDEFLMLGTHTDGYAGREIQISFYSIEIANLKAGKNYI